MTEAELDSAEEMVNPALAELAEQITRDLQAGESLDLEAYVRHYPRWAEPIRRLLPTLRQLTRLDQTVNPDLPGR